MSSTAQVAPVGRQPTNNPRGLEARLWGDGVRYEQRRRFESLQLQHCLEAAHQAQALIANEIRQIDPEARIDLVSDAVIAALFGLMRTGFKLKKKKILKLELGLDDIGELIGYSKSTVAAAIRLLGCEPITHKGVVVGRGVGLLHRCRRTAWARMDGQRRRVYRTSRMVLTITGKMLLGLMAGTMRGSEPKKMAPKPRPTPTQPAPHRKQLHDEGLGSAGGGEDDTVPTDVGRHWLDEIKKRI